MIQRSTRRCDSPSSTEARTASEPSATRAAAVVELKKALDRYVGIPLQVALHGLGLLTGLFRREPGVREVRHIVLAKLWGIGNLAMILPYLRGLRRQFPDAEITFLTLRRNRPMLEGHAALAHVVCLRDEHFWSMLWDLGRAILFLRRRPPDLFLDFEQFLRITGIVARLSGARHAVGFDTSGQHRARLYQARVRYDAERHMATVFGDVVRCAGVDVSGLPPLEVPRSAAAGRRMGERLAEIGPGPWIALHPGSGDNFPGRRWPVARFAEVGARLARTPGAVVLVTGTASESALAARLSAALRERGVRAVDLSGAVDLPEFIELLARVDLLVSNDTGPVHLASAVGTNLVALYGPNTPRIYGPLHAQSRVLDHRLPCSPCLTNQGAKSSRCQYPACILAIEPDEVVAAGRELLAASARRAERPVRP